MHYVYVFDIVYYCLYVNQRNIMTCGPEKKRKSQIFKPLFMLLSFF